MNKGVFIFLIFFIIVFSLVLLVSFLKKPSQSNQPNVPIPTFTTPSPASPSPTGTQTIYDQQIEWAQSQNQYNQENPWHSKLPLKSNDYFISYDPTNDSFIATVYYSTSSAVPKDQQIANSKTEAINAIKNLDPSLASKPVSFIPTASTSGQ